MTRALLLIAAAALTIGCSGSSTADKPDTAPGDAEAGLNCGDAQAQRMLTYCASPEAAELALRNERARKAIAAGNPDPELMPIPVGTSPSKGPADAEVTVVMFGDLECPYCAQSHEAFEKLQAKYPKRVRLVYKHFPLSIHERAVPAARAAMAAGQQGKFWEYVDLAYRDQENLDDAGLATFAQKAGVDMAKFNAARASESFDAQIKSDLELGRRLGIDATPSFAINGVLVTGAFPFKIIEDFAKEQLELAEKLTKVGVPKSELYWRLMLAQYRARPPVEPPAPAIGYVPVGASPATGASADKALVTVVEFSDFECPYCADAVEPLKAAVDAHKDKVRLVYKHYPLPNHPRAMPAAIASIVADKEGKFWPMHDMLFANQDKLGDDDLKGFAAKLGIKADVLAKGEDFKKQIAADMALAEQHGVEGTPSFFVNGKRMLGGMSAEEWKAVFAKEIERAEALAKAQGKSGDELYKALVDDALAKAKAKAP